MTNEDFVRQAIHSGIVKDANRVGYSEWEGGVDVIVYFEDSVWSFETSSRTTSKTNERRYASGHDADHAWLAARNRINEEMTKANEIVKKWEHLCALDVIQK